MELLPYKELMRSLRKKRMRLGITQKELANRAGIGASMLNQMEHGNANANYATVYRVWEQLKIMEPEEARTAQALMNQPIAWLAPDDTAVTVRTMMREHNYSQLPVRQDGELVGSVTEADMIGVDEADRPVHEFMGEPFETVGPDTGRDVVIAMLKDGQDALIVGTSGDYLGIITKADVL